MREDFRREYAENLWMMFLMTGSPVIYHDYFIEQHELIKTSEIDLGK